MPWVKFIPMDHWKKFALASLLGVVVGGRAFGGTGGTHCGFSVFFADNLTVKADVADGQLRIDKEGSFRIYLYNTLTWPFYDAKLDVLSDQFDAKVEPSPTWQTFPDLTPACAGGGREYFTVTLTRKQGVADGPYDVVFKLYSSRRDYRRLSQVLPLGEVMDRQVIPVRAGFSVDGKASPGKWAGSLLVKDFRAYRGFKPHRAAGPDAGDALKSSLAGEQTRVHVAADDENLYFLVLMAGVSAEDEVAISVAPTIEAKPVRLVLKQATGNVEAPIAANQIECRKCAADPRDGNIALYELRVSRQALGLGAAPGFYANFGRVAHGGGGIEKSYWRGNEISQDEPTVYGKLVFEGEGADRSQAETVNQPREIAGNR